MKVPFRQSITLLLVAFAATAQAAVLSTGASRVVVRQIKKALDDASIRVSEEQIEMLTSVPTSTPDAAVRVDELKLLSPKLARVRMRCESAADCIPFFVLVHGDIKPGAEVVKASPRVARKSTVIRRAENLVHSGTHARLFLESDTMSITLQVICLEAGSEGQIIRVASMDRKIKYSAEIVSADTLKARLN